MTAREIERWERHVATKRWLHAQPCTVVGEMDEPPCAGETHGALDARPLAAFTDGPVADTPEPVTPDRSIPRADSDRDDGHTVSHG